MAKLTFYPIGNADSTLVELNDGRIILKDYCNRLNCEDGRVRLDDEIRNYLKKRNRDSIDYGIFSHADDDHVHGADEFFWLQHAAKYQSDNRVRIKEMWVPACFILEEGTQGCAKILRQEARYRFIRGKDIRVFGNPEPLEAWLRNQGRDPRAYTHLIAKAGQCLRGFDQYNGAVEIFPHSPFSFRMEGEPDNRNGNSIVLHLTFFEGNQKLRCMLGADGEHQAWSDIVYITRNRGNSERLEWDLFRISHHCSHTAVSPDKGAHETVPIPAVAYLFEQGSRGSRLISSSNSIPYEDTDQPPHRQTAAFYRRVARDNGSEDNFLVTMEWPSHEDPRPIIAETTSYGFAIRQGLSNLGGVSTVTSNSSPRFGVDGER